MMSLSLIRAMSNEAAWRSRELGEDQPMVCNWPDDVRKAPHLGYLKPEGWQLARVLFCDSTGMGSRGEPALTLRELTEEVVIGRAYSIMETGQFQIHLAEWVREGEELPEVDTDRKGVFPPGGFEASMAEAEQYMVAREASEGFWAEALEPLPDEVAEEARSYIDDEYGTHEVVWSVAEAVQLLKDWDLYHGGGFDAEPGSVSHGTLRTQDLLEAFTAELKRLRPEHKLLAEAERRIAAFSVVPLFPADDEDASWLVIEGLMDALNECAPDGHYFGAHEGDGSDFGFWPVPDEEGA